MNEKTLTILLGNARGGEPTWETIYNNLLDVYNSDLALLFGKKDNKTESLYTKAKYIWEITEYKDWYDYYNEHCDGKWWEFFKKNEAFGTSGGIKNFSGSGAIIFAFRHYLKNNLKHIAELYDRIILTRSDYYYIDKHPFLPNDKLYIVEGENYGGVSDRHHIFPSSLWDKVLGVVEFIGDNSYPIGNPETVLKKMLDFNKIDYSFCKRVQFAVATKSDTTRWQVAKMPMPQNKDLMIKYKSEYDLAMQNKNNLKHEICIVRPTYYDRSAMLQLSLEYQKEADNSDKFETYIFVDPHNEHGIASDYDKVITDEYKRITWTKNSGKYSWYHSVKYIFDNTDYEYVITIEDDVLISKDYLRMCEQLALYDDALSKDDDILYFHIGAWEKPKGNPNRIVRSTASIRSCLISRFKFTKYIKPYYDSIKEIDGLDLDLKNILVKNNMTTISPETNRHAHIGIYGWSANHVHSDNRGQKSLSDKPLTHEEMYSLLKENCLSGSKLLELNQYKNPDYFWDFDANINFTNLEYNL